MALTAMEKRVIDAFVDGDPEPPMNRTSYEIRHQPVTVRGRTIKGTQLRGPMNSELADRTPDGMIIWVGTGGTRYQDSVYRYLKKTVPARIFEGHASERKLSRNGVRKEWKDSNASNIYADLEGGTVRVFYNRRIRRWQIEGSADGADLWVKDENLSFATAELAQEYAEAKSFDYAYDLIEASEEEAGLD